MSMSDALKSWSEQYRSDIVSVRLPLVPFTIVALNSYAAMREALTSAETSDVLTGRPPQMGGPENEESAGMYSVVIFSTYFLLRHLIHLVF